MAKTTGADRALLMKLSEHFVLLKRIAVSPEPIRCNGEKISKWRAISLECDAAREKILEHCK